MKKIPDFFSDGTYKGQMKNGVPHGKGIYTSKFETKSRKKISIFIKVTGLMEKSMAKQNTLTTYLPTLLISKELIKMTYRTVMGF